MLNNFVYIETSAITNNNIKECFDLILHILLEKNNKNIKEEIKQEEVDENNKDKNIVNKQIKKDNIILIQNNNHMNNNVNNNTNNYLSNIYS